MTRSMLRNKFFARVAAVAVILLLGIHSPAFGQNGGKREIDVATVNLYLGADVSPITTLSPLDPAFKPKLVAAVVTTYGRIVASNFPARAAAMAQEIVAREPDVVALQEVALIRRQSPGDSVVGGNIPAT